MNCRLATPLLNAYLDGELAVSETQRVSDHLAECTNCTQQVTDLKTLQSTLGSAALYHHAPGTLRSRVTQSLAAGASTSIFTQPMSIKSAVAVVVGIGLFAGTIGAGWWWMHQPAPRPSQLSQLSQDLSLSCNRKTEVTTSDSQMVKQWLLDKAGRTVNVKDLSAHKFKLIGARVESSAMGTIPVLVYTAGDKTVSLYHWPIHCGQRQHACSPTEPNYLISNWNDAKMIYWAISDLPADQLEEFERLMKGSSGAGK